MTDHLAEELRGIAQDAADTEAHPVIAERLLKLVEHVEQVGEPDEHTLEVAGLDTEQEIRRNALVTAQKLMERCGIVYDVSQVLDVAEVFAAYIRTGQRPS